MARAYYTCPECKRSIEVGGINRRDADRKAEWLANSGRVCRDCANKAATEDGIQFAKENNLPPLTGTPKQIAWAESIRHTLLDSLDENISHIVRTLGQKELFSEELRAEVHEYFRGINRASLWIDMRLCFGTHIKEWLRPQLAAQAIPADIRGETIVRPEHSTSCQTVILEVQSEQVSIQTVKDEKLTETLLQQGCTWNHYLLKWLYRLYDNKALNVAHLASAILEAGFAVQILNSMEALEILAIHDVERIAYLVEDFPHTGKIMRTVIFRWGEDDATEWLQEHFPGINFAENKNSAKWLSSPTILGELRAAEEEARFFISPELREYIAHAKAAYADSVIHKAPRRKRATAKAADVAPELLDN